MTGKKLFLLEELFSCLWLEDMLFLEDENHQVLHRYRLSSRGEAEYPCGHPTVQAAH